MCLSGSVSCQVMLEGRETYSACLRWSSSLSLYNAASCSCIKGIGDLIHSIPHTSVPHGFVQKWLEVFSHVLSLLLNVNIWIVLNTFSSTRHSNLCDYSSRVSFWNQINANPLSLKNPRNCMFWPKYLNVIAKVYVYIPCYVLRWLLSACWGWSQSSHNRH